MIFESNAIETHAILIIRIKPKWSKIFFCRMWVKAVISFNKFVKNCGKTWAYISDIGTYFNALCDFFVFSKMKDISCNPVTKYGHGIPDTILWLLPHMWRETLQHLSKRVTQYENDEKTMKPVWAEKWWIGLLWPSMPETSASCLILRG